MKNEGARIGGKISDLTTVFEGFPFVGMLMRTYLTCPEMEDVDIFHKTLQLYDHSISNMSKHEIEESFLMFTHIPLHNRRDFVKLYKIITNGAD